MAAVCTFSEQLLGALNYRYNNNGEYEESSREASKKWLEQIVATGVLLNYHSLLTPSVVRMGYSCRKQTSKQGTELVSSYSSPVWIFQRLGT